MKRYKIKSNPDGFVVYKKRVFVWIKDGEFISLSQAFLRIKELSGDKNYNVILV